MDSLQHLAALACAIGPISFTDSTSSSFAVQDASSSSNARVVKKKRSCRKRSRAEFSSDDNPESVDADRDQERAPPNRSSGKKQNRRKRQKNPRTRRRRQQLPADDNQPPLIDLPQGYKNKIAAMGGGEITPIIEKSLYASDLNKQQNRLSIPVKKMRNNEGLGFLREGEARVLARKEAIKVQLIQPSLELTTISLAKWRIGRNASSYVLRSPWSKVAEDNQLQQNDVVQVWSFRVQEQLCMALVKL